MPPANYDECFIVSTLGQARNAIVIRNDELTSSRVIYVILETKANKRVPDKIQQLFIDSGADSERIMLPEKPTSPTPRKIKRIHDIYEDFLNRTKPKNLWISNANVHYAMLASIAYHQGVTINYFEEGVGTYKTKDDPSFTVGFNHEGRLATFKKRFSPHFRRFVDNSIIASLFVALINEIIEVFRFIGRVIHEIVYFAYTFDFFRRLFIWLMPYRMRYFFKVWTKYTNVRVAFPALLDPELFKADNLNELAVSVEGKDIDYVNQVIAEFGNIPRSIFISQGYGGNEKAYYEAVGKCIANRSSGMIFVKFHPRETTEQRAWLKEALLRHDVDSVSVEALDQKPAEILLATGHFTDIFGLTSSSLIYGTKLTPNSVFVSVAKEVANQLDDTDFSPTLLRRLRKDIDLFDGIFQKLTTNRTET